MVDENIKLFSDRLSYQSLVTGMNALRVRECVECGERGSQPVSSHSPLQLQSITSSLSSCSPAQAHKYSDIQSHDLSTLFLLPLNMKSVCCVSNLDAHLQEGRAPPLPRACAVVVINAGSRGWHWPGGQSQEPGVRDITTPQHTTLPRHSHTR